jgi:hypothetical protein
MVAVVKGNRREIPGNLPPLLWWEKVEEYRTDPRTRSLRFFDPRMEVLSPDELARVRAKALIWWEVTDELPTDISTWWEIRMARRVSALRCCDGWRGRRPRNGRAFV